MVSMGMKEAMGSSPLARGLRDGGLEALVPVRIIPARAGFTRPRTSAARAAADHPRSRGVYGVVLGRGLRHGGSSPLARGLLPVGIANDDEARIIPARAGFTALECPTQKSPGDHPRSRGVYSSCPGMTPVSRGSSPLARGLHRGRRYSRTWTGIIPARAGFTDRTGVLRADTTDHPRSRGVYTCGSLESQRTRTLPDPCCLHCRPRARSAELR